MNPFLILLPLVVFLQSAGGAATGAQGVTAGAKGASTGARGAFTGSGIRKAKNSVESIIKSDLFKNCSLYPVAQISNSSDFGSDFKYCTGPVDLDEKVLEFEPVQRMCFSVLFNLYAVCAPNPAVQNRTHHEVTLEEIQKYSKDMKNICADIERSQYAIHCDGVEQDSDREECDRNAKVVKDLANNEQCSKTCWHDQDLNPICVHWLFTMKVSKEVFAGEEVKETQEKEAPKTKEGVSNSSNLGQSGHGRPLYLSIDGYERCVGQMNGSKTHTEVCLPPKQPEGCLDSVYQQLVDLFKDQHLCPIKYAEAAKETTGEEKQEKEIQNKVQAKEDGGNGSHEVESTKNVSVDSEAKNNAKPTALSKLMSMKSNLTEIVKMMKAELRKKFPMKHFERVKTKLTNMENEDVGKKRMTSNKHVKKILGGKETDKVEQDDKMTEVTGKDVNQKEETTEGEEETEIKAPKEDVGADKDDEINGDKDEEKVEDKDEEKVEDKIEENNEDITEDKSSSTDELADRDSGKSTPSQNETEKSVEAKKADKAVEVEKTDEAVKDNEKTTVFTTTTTSTPEEGDVQKNVLAPPKLQKDDEENTNADDDIESGKGKDFDFPDTKGNETPLKELDEDQRRLLDDHMDTYKTASEQTSFFSYFLLLAIVAIIAYLVFHNKQKILALILEGRRKNGGRRYRSAQYKKLDNNLEEAMGPNDSDNMRHIIY